MPRIIDRYVIREVVPPFLLALLVFAGGSIRIFVLALFVGILSGTYSSIFNASPLLVWWEERTQARAASRARSL